MSAHKIGPGSIIPFPCWLKRHDWIWSERVIPVETLLANGINFYSTNPPDQRPLGEPAPEGSLPVTSMQYTGKHPKDHATGHDDSPLPTPTATSDRDKLTALLSEVVVIDEDHKLALLIGGYERVVELVRSLQPPAPSLQSVAEGAIREYAEAVDKRRKYDNRLLMSEKDALAAIITRHFAPLLTAREAETRDWIKWHGALQERLQDAQAQIAVRDERIERLERELDLARKLFAQRGAGLTDTLNECVPIEAERNALRTRCEELQRDKDAMMDELAAIGVEACPIRDPLKVVGGDVKAADAQFDKIRLMVVEAFRKHGKSFFQHEYDKEKARAARKEGQQAHEKGEGT